MSADTRERTFQDHVVAQMLKDGWQLGKSTDYDRERALYSADCLTYVKKTQPKAWNKFAGLHPKNPDKAFLDRLTQQLAKADPNAADGALRTFGTLGVLRHGLHDRSVFFQLCQFAPDHGLNPDTQAAYKANILRVVPELVYSPYTTKEHLAQSGAKAKKWRIDLVLFLNGLPIATLELKSDFKQAIDNAKKQYKEDRRPKDPATNKPEPLLTFKRGALVHFALSQTEAWMTTRLAGADTYFLPFNKGTKDGGAGNDVPDDIGTYPTEYLWTEVLAPNALIKIVARFVHLEIKEVEDWEGRKSKKETLIFPRYHQWDLVNRLIDTTREEGPGHKYLVQHSAGSGKSNSIAWTAHQLASLHDADGERLFHSVIVVTDRTVLDNQLRDTIHQIEHRDGVVLGIRRDEGSGSKSEQLAHALEHNQPILTVTLQTFPFVLDHIADSTVLKDRRYAIIADEAHSSQSGTTAKDIQKTLSKDEDDGEPVSGEDKLNREVEARKASGNISYYAFTATPKAKTMQLFGRPPNPDEEPSKTNPPEAFHVYSMRQAIEEGYILDVLRNYTSYKVAYRLAEELEKDPQVDAKRAALRLNQWIRLHDHGIGEKVTVIVEHFRKQVMGLLGGQTKAMIVTGSRKEAVRYKLEFEKYVAEQGYDRLAAMVAFSDEVTFTKNDPNAEALLDRSFNERNMNPGLKGREIRKAFDTDEYHVMIVANKFQTGFDQPKLCAMYVDKPLGGIECVQTLSRLNRIHPGKEETYIVDFLNEPDDVLEAFQKFYQTAELLDVSDPNLIWDLFHKLRAADVFRWTEVEQLVEVFFIKGKSDRAVGNICKPAVERWQHRLERAKDDHARHKDMFERAQKTGDPVLIANTERDMKDAKREIDTLALFKKDLGSFTRYYEFMSQIVDYDSTELEKLSLYARHLHPLLREKNPEADSIDLSSVALSHYRLSKIRQQHLRLEKDADTGLEPATEVGTGKARDKDEERLSEIIARLNELYVIDGLNDTDQLNYLNTITDKVAENETVLQQARNNSIEQAMHGIFPSVLDAAVIECGEVHQNQMVQYLNNKEIQDGFGRLVFGALLERFRADRPGA